MRRIVSNTSPLTNLAAIGQLNLLHRLFGRVDIAHAVWDELNANGRSWPGRDEVARASWIVRQIPNNGALIRALQRDLDRGESESIALAVELGADLILLDEQDGRRLAQQQGLKPMGVVGVLLLAKQSGLLPAIRPELDALRTDAGFWLGDSVYARCIVILAFCVQGFQDITIGHLDPCALDLERGRQEPGFRRQGAAAMANALIVAKLAKSALTAPSRALIARWMRGWLRIAGAGVVRDCYTSRLLAFRAFESK